MTVSRATTRFIVTTTARQPSATKGILHISQGIQKPRHMRRTTMTTASGESCVYISHLPVIRESSVTSRLRVILNASSRTSNGTSLNDHLLSGPKLQANLPAVILKWRAHKFVYSADITKMYRQILLDERDLDFHHILWKSHPSDGALGFQLLTVTYGTACAPFLALRVIK